MRPMPGERSVEASAPGLAVSSVLRAGNGDGGLVLVRAQVACPERGARQVYLLQGARARSATKGEGRRDSDVGVVAEGQVSQMRVDLLSPLSAKNVKRVIWKLQEYIAHEMTKTSVSPIVFCL